MRPAYLPAICPRCESVGTIVDLGICCRIRRWMAMGALWELKFCPDSVPARHRKTAGRPRVRG
jgi:hypothetical protein